MHDSLRPQNFSRLPVSLRRIAITAASGSVDALKKLCAEIPRLSITKVVLLIPAFFINLDPARIPNLEEGVNMAHFRAALSAVDGIYASQKFIPLGAMKDIWARYWAWIQFIEFYSGMTHPESLPDREEDLCADVVMFVSRFADDERLAGLIADSPGLRTRVARYWWFLVRKEYSQERDHGFDFLTSCLDMPLDASNSEGLDEFIDGAGGSLNDLATLAVTTLTTLVPTHGTGVSTETVERLRSILQFIITAVRFKESDRSYRREALSTALRVSGLAGALTRVIANLSLDADAEYALHDALMILGLHFNADQGHLWVVSALDSGHDFLNALLQCGNLPPESAAHTHLGFFFQAIFPAALIYYPVVCAFEKHLPSVEDADAVGTWSFARKKLWRDFLRLAAERFAVRTHLESPGFEVLAACANMECNAIRPKSSLKRCFGCKSEYYCSRACQALDWRQGGHRQVCKRGQAITLSEDQNLSHRERNFLRLVLQEDYNAHSSDTIYPAQVFFLQQSPNDPYMTVFDYTSGRARIQVDSATQSAVAEELRRISGVEWETAISRARLSDGRMELHVVRIGGNKDPRYWLIPLRSTASALPWLKRMAVGIPAAKGSANPQKGLEAVFKDVQGLVYPGVVTSVH